MADVEEIMEKIAGKTNPTIFEMKKYVRYLINVKKMEPGQVLETTSHWDDFRVENAIKQVEQENTRPKPKRYYVSLKEPLEDSMYE